MRNRCILFALFLFIGLLPKANAQTASRAGSPATMQFIEGHWKATQPDGLTVEGTWLAPEGDNMVGMMRMMKDGKVTMYEILAYENSDEGLVSLVKHFKPGLIGLEEKDKYDRYNFLEAGKDRVLYQKEGGDLRIAYEKRGADQFAIQRGNQENGKWVFKDLFVFNRVK